MRASARIVARCQADGSTRLTTLAGEAPLLLRRAARQGAKQAPDEGAPPDGAGTGGPARVYLAGGTAGPLGGDELRCSVDLGPGARLEVHGVDASVALPGPHGRESALEIHARVGEGGALSWSPRPLVAARGARHRTVARVELAADALLVWRDELILGRDGEDPGSVSTRLRVLRAGRVLLDREVAFGPRHPGSLGPAGSGAHRAIGSLLVVDPAWASAPVDGVPSGSPLSRLTPQDEPAVAVAVLRLSGPAVLVTAAASGAAALARVLDGAI
ncbi:urease accessory protein UreD [Actinocrinis puniceicyclus]|uniref:Urease accessory protein UreD n=1 Tax=Actinocrinis puniceicyclus TaxID=977794 RepID=A0A8J7WMA1_9ACTN|nr:urease accessory protein UreD [Actinocrinis puniceicyclus]MBS2965006.1 urease accessory protein UreD [Actinocrinis puniceicyclus]